MLHNAAHFFALNVRFAHFANSVQILNCLDIWLFLIVIRDQHESIAVKARHFNSETTTAQSIVKRQSPTIRTDYQTSRQLDIHGNKITR